MKAFVITAVMPNEWTAEELLATINRGIQQRLREKPPESNVSALNWSVGIKDQFSLERQDI